MHAAAGKACSTLVHFRTRSWLAWEALMRGEAASSPAAPPPPLLPPPLPFSVSFFQKKLLKK